MYLTNTESVYDSTFARGNLIFPVDQLISNLLAQISQ